MKKKNLIIVFGIVIIVGIILQFANNNKNIYTEIDGIKYAIYVNNQSANSFPQGDYKVDLDCENAYGYWDSINNKVIINDIIGSVSCYISFSSITDDDYLNNYVIGLADVSHSSSGAVIHEVTSEFTSSDNQKITDAGYRYEGNNPNNYIWFNNELWRIIGVFGPESHGQVGKQLTKIMRYNPIGSFVRNSSNSIAWASSNLYNLLNNAYYNHTTDNENCYNQAGSIPILKPCDFTVTGIQSEFYNMIEDVTWYLGGHNSTNTVGAFSAYQSERIGKMPVSSLSKTANGKIGLMYLSDFLLSGLSSACSRLGNTCFSSWMNRAVAFGTMSVNSYYSTSSTYNYSFYGYNGSNIYTTSYNSAFPIHPVLYLSSSVYIVDGNGTKNDPYIIAMSNS